MIIMVFKINVSDKGKTLKLELESEELIRLKIGDKLKGSVLSEDLEGYELQITGTSDESGFPGFKGKVGSQLRKVLLKKGEKGLRDRTKGIRKKKTIRGEEITEKTSQINMVVLKQGKKKFEELLPKKEENKIPEEGKKEESVEKKEEKP